MYFGNAVHHCCYQDAYQPRHHPLGVWVAGHIDCNPLQLKQGTDEGSQSFSSPVVVVPPKMIHSFHQASWRFVPGQFFHECLICQITFKSVKTVYKKI